MTETGGARHTDPETSHDAAKSINATRLQLVVLDVLWRNQDKLRYAAFNTSVGGLTTWEIEEVLRSESGRSNCCWGSITPRMKPMYEKQWVVKLHERRVHPESGRMCIIWRATDIGGSCLTPEAYRKLEAR